MCTEASVCAISHVGYLPYSLVNCLLFESLVDSFMEYRLKFVVYVVTVLLTLYFGQSSLSSVR